MHDSSLRAPRLRLYSRLAVLTALSLLLALASGLPAAAAPAVQDGDAAPPFSLMSSDGGSWSLGDHRGKIVLLFFLGHNAAVCIDAARDVEFGLHQMYGSQGLDVVGIDCWDGTTEQVRLFAAATGVSFPLLFNGGSVASAYDLSYHSFVLVDGHGIVREVHAGPDASAFNLSGLQQSVQTLLQEANAAQDATWGAIKALYGR